MGGMSLQPTSRRVQLLAGAAAALLLFGACTSDDPEPEARDEPVKESPTPEDVSKRPRNPITATNKNTCNPQQVGILAPETTAGSLLVRNESDQAVTFVLPQRDVELTIEPGSTSQIDYLVPEEGENVTWSCEFENGKTYEGEVIIVS
ncbi:MAG: hypothetical protein ACRDKZ_07575 [Actinomycetota bacterium]